ncbi:MAG: hypothetical protein MZV64_21685 [Ignavibacteriales bacterium]|nr:hypothetical protein [Ignavibacteriales bacterium]
MGPTDGVYAFAVREDASQNKSVVSGLKPKNQDWQNENIVLESCDCADLSAQVLEYSYWSITFEDTLNGQRRIFGMDNWAMPPNIYAECRYNMRVIFLRLIYTHC